jgi:hypothetical protein
MPSILSSQAAVAVETQQRRPASHLALAAALADIDPLSSESRLAAVLAQKVEYHLRWPHTPSQSAAVALGGRSIASPARMEATLFSVLLPRRAAALVGHTEPIVVWPVAPAVEDLEALDLILVARELHRRVLRVEPVQG